MLDNTPRTSTIQAASDSPPDRLKQVEALTEVCTDELLAAFGLGGVRRCRRPLEGMARLLVRRLAAQAATYDEIVGRAGLAAGGDWALERMARSVEVEGRENVPREGPLLIVSNHPGLADALALFATVPRDELRVVAAHRPFLEALPHTSRYLFTIEERSQERLGLVREAARSLKSGGAVLTFPGGRIEPDPEVLPGACERLDEWSGSAELFARLVPGLTVVPVAVSGVLSPAALRNPLTLLRRRTEDRRWLAATLQMLTPALRGVTTRVTFGPPIRAEDERSVNRRAREEMRLMLRERP